MHHAEVLRVLRGGSFYDVSSLRPLCFPQQELPGLSLHPALGFGSWCSQVLL